MPELREKESVMPVCEHCGLIIVARVPKGLKGIFTHIDCREHYETNFMQSRPHPGRATTRGPEDVWSHSDRLRGTAGPVLPGAINGE